jgi:hypothetical protein
MEVTILVGDRAFDKEDLWINILISFRPETALFRNLCVNLRI